LGGEQAACRHWLIRCANWLNLRKGTKSDIEIAPAKRFEAVVQIGSGGVVVTGDKLLAGAISQQVSLCT